MSPFYEAAEVLAGTQSGEDAVQRAGILIVEDFPVLMAALASLLKQSRANTPLEATDSLDEARQRLEAVPRELLVVDISLQKNAGPTFIREVHQKDPGLPVLCLSLHDDVFFAELCFQAGARGFVTKADTPEEVVEGIEAVLKGQYFVSRKVKRRENLELEDGGPPRIRKPEDVLTEREFVVLQQIGEGRSSAEIARSLNLSRKTVQIEQVSIKRKLNLRTSFDLTQLAVRMFDKRLSYR